MWVVSLQDPNKLQQREEECIMYNISWLTNYIRMNPAQKKKVPIYTVYILILSIIDTRAGISSNLLLPISQLQIPPPSSFVILFVE